MRITFVLPAPIRIPMGGAKVVYTHAAGLVARGHEVVVACPSQLGGGLKGRMLSWAMHLRDRAHNVDISPYYRASGVETVIVPTITDRFVPDAEVVIATGVQTAPWVRDLGSGKGTKAYFLQHVETFIDPTTVDTWHYPLEKIAIAEWIKVRVEEEGASVVGVVPNAVDPRDYFIANPISDRPARIIALYHRHKIKGPDVLIAALIKLKLGVPELEADVFCARRPSHRLPSWVIVHVRPSVEKLRDLYNQAAVVWSTSRSEGWGLVTMEGAACGCAVVASATEGIKEYLSDPESARLVPVGDPEALAEATRAVLENSEERTRLAHAGHSVVGKYTWADSTAELERILKG